MTKCAELANLIGNINAGGGGVNRNVIINGAMNVAQRGTSSTGIASSDYYTCDRWRIILGGANGRLTMTQDSSAPSGFANSIKLDCTTADTSIASGEVLILQHKIEGQNLQGFAKGTSDAKPFALSFYVKGNASATYVAELMDNDNTRQVSKSFTVGTDWTRVELTFPADTTGAFDDDNGASLDLMIWLHGGSTYTSGTLNETWASRTDANRAVGISSFFDSTDRTFFITGVQLEVGQNPTSFEHEPFERTLQKCLRYTFVHQTDVAYGISALSGFVADTTVTLNLYQFPVEMRSAPTLSTSGSFIMINGSESNAISGSFSLQQPSTHNARVDSTLGSNSTLGRVSVTRNNNDADASLTFDAEL